jgi:peroxiredoxin Q/BCP
MKTMFMLAALAALAATARALEVGDAAPPFSAPSTAGEISLDAFKGKWLVLYFYPKSFTPGCTKEACSLRDGIADLGALKASVVGVSADDLETQRKFKEAHRLPFDLIADTDKAVSRAHGALGIGSLYVQRRTFLVSPDGRIAHVFDAVNVTTHAADVKAALEKRQAGR